MPLLKKLLVYATTAVAMIAMTLVVASACTGIYVGSANTADGSTYFARSEDITNSKNKLLFVSDAGSHKAGEEYEGCHGWTYTFTKDSYRYTAFRDDNLQGVCPNCGGTHEHVPFEAAGTNSQGVSVTATITETGNSAVCAIDPIHSGIQEAEIPTILLSEASTAREGVELLLSIYEEAGAWEGSGVFIADQKETWYVENTTGHQYIALKLPEDLIFVNPNMAILGEIDLDDENVIASEGLIQVAQEAGTFVGDAEEHIINFRASYGRTNVQVRMVNGLNYLNSSYNYTVDTITSEDFTVSNVKDGKIVPAYSAITADHKLTIQDMVNFYKVDSIANTATLDYQIFSVSSTGALETAITEWIGMDHGKYSVAVPYFPMLTTDTYAGYQVSTDRVSYVTAKPSDSKAYYAVSEFRYVVLPDGWRESCYWSTDALSNSILRGNYTEQQQQVVQDNLAAIQEICYQNYENLKKQLSTLLKRNPTGAAEAATTSSAYLAELSHRMTLALYDYLKEGTDVSTDKVYYLMAQGQETFVALPDQTLSDFTLPQGYRFKNAGTAKPQATETVITSNGGTFQVRFTVLQDVGSDQWYSESVRTVVQQGLFEGYSDGTFRPDAQMTRAMVVTVLWRLCGEPEPEHSKTVFTDVSTGVWYAKAVAWAKENSITDGKSATNFAPNASITREEFVTMLYRYEKLLGSELTAGALDQSAFTDLGNLSSYAQEPMAWAVQQGLINGYNNGSLRPTATIRRCEAAKILAAALVG